MSQPAPGFEPTVHPAVTVPAATPPGAVTAAVVSMLLLAVIGLVGSVVALVEHVSKSLRVPLTVDFVLQQNLLGLALCVLVAVLALGVWTGSSAARLATFAVIGLVVIVAAARTVGQLAAVIHGIDMPYEDPWRANVISMWLYLLGAAVMAVPIVLLNRRSATRWFRDRRPGALPPADPDAVTAPPALSLARAVLGMATVLTVLLTVLSIVGLATSAAGPEPEATTELVVKSLAYATVPLLVLTAAIVEAGSGSRFGQVTAFAATGYVVYLGSDAVYAFLSGDWHASLPLFGTFAVTVAIAAAGVAALLLLLRPAVVDHFARNAVVVDLGAALAELALSEDDEEADEDEADAPDPDRG